MIDESDNPTTPGPSDGQPPPPAIGPPPPTMEPPPPAAGSARRLVRDPTARLGGVASGLSHYFGIDGSLLRVGFVVFTFFSGVGLVAYLLLWIVVPRSDYWPPLYSQNAVPAPPRLSNRDVLVSFALLLALAALVFQTGWGLSWLVGLLLVAGAVWLLNQQAGPETEVAYGQAADGIVPVRVAPRRRRGWIFALFGSFVALLLVGGLVTALVIGSSNSFDFEFGPDRVNSELEPGTSLEPASVDEIPTVIDSDAGQVVLDLGRLEAGDFDLATPIGVEVSLNAGEIVVLVPEGLEVDVSARVRIGDVTVFGDYRDGFGSSVSLDSPDEVLDLDLSVGLGEIRVERS